MPGPRPTPTALKVLRGNPGKRPLNKHEPTLKAAAPRPPPFLSSEAKKRYRKLSKALADAGVMTELDADALALYCDAWATWKMATIKIRDAGDALVEINPAGGASRSPWLIIQEKAYIQMRQMLSEFGLSPATRSKITRIEKQVENDEWAGL